MPTERLEYQFDESGLDQLRSDMEALSSDTEDVGESAQDTASDLEDMGSDGTDVAGDITSDMEDAEGAIGELGDEAQQTAGQMEEEFQVASDEVRSQIEKMSEDLTAFNEMGVNGGGGGAASQLADVGGSALAEGVGTGAALGLKDMMDASRFESLTEQLQPQQAIRKVEELDQALKNVNDRLTVLEATDASPRDINEAQQKADQLATELQDAVENAERLGVELEDLDTNIDADGVEDLGDGIGDAGDAAEDAGDDMGGLMESAAAAKTALMAMSNPVTAVTAIITAVGTAAATATKQVADFAAAQAESAQQLKVIEAQSGVSATKAQELFMIAQRLDSQVDLDTVKDAFKELALRTQEAREGTGEAREAFDRLDISMQELEGASTAEVFNKVRNAASDLNKQQRMLTLEQIAGGEAGEQLARVFGLQADEYNRLKDAVQDDTLSDDQVKRMDDLRQEYTDAQQSLQDLQNEMALTFGPEAVDMMQTFTEAAQKAVDAWRGERETGVLSKSGRPTPDEDDPVNTPPVQDPTMGPDKNKVDFGEEEEPAQGLQRMRKVLSQTKIDIAAVRRKYKEGLIPKGEMKRQIKSFRQQAADQLIRLKEEFPGIIPDGAVAKAIAKYKKMRREVAKMDKTEVPGQGVSDAPAGADPASTVELPSRAIDPSGLAADMQQRAANMRRAYEDELSNLEEVGKAVGQSLTRSISRSANQAFSAIGQGLTDMIFGGGGGGPSTAQAKLSLFNAKDQVRSMRSALRKGQMSYRQFSMKMKVQQDKIQKRQEKLNDSMQSGFANAAEKMVSAFKKAAKQLIAEVIAVIVKMLILKAITEALTMGGGGIGGAIVTQLGGGAFLNSGASGGMVKSSGLAEIHEDEQIMNAETVSMLDSMLQPSSAAMGASTPSTQPAAMASAGAGGGGLELTVNVTGETTTDGRDLKTSYDQTTRIQRRKGRRE